MRMLAEALRHEVLLADAAIEERLRTLRLDVERDLFGAPSCFAVLNLTRWHTLRELYKDQLRAGADIVRTNTSQASPLELKRFGLEEDAFAINYAAAQIAADAVDAVPGGDRRRFVLGIVRDLGWDATSREIEEATALQASALLAGGVDGIALAVASDACRGPALLEGARSAREEANSAAGIFIWQDGRERSQALRRFSDGVIRHRQVTSSAQIPGDTNLISGTRPEDTALLDQVLRSIAENSARPPIATCKSPEAAFFSPMPRRSSVQKSRGRSPSPTANVIYCASRWAQRR